MGQRVRSTVALVVGIVLVLLSLSTISMCGPNRHIYGALVGSLGGVLLGLAHRAPRLKWFALVGGVAGAVATVVAMKVLHDSCDDLLLAVLAGAFMGVGVGLLADAARPGGHAPGPPPASESR